MVDEANVVTSLQIMQTDVQYLSQPQVQTEDVAEVGGPTPGYVIATTAGVNVDFSALVTLGLCRIQNLDDTNYIDVGIWDPESIKFYPFMRLLPGMAYVFRLSPDLQEEYGTGTGTSGADTNRLQIRANTATCKVKVEAFEN